ncbi:hypothetical protein GOM49_11400 [Clostridium bovifaecis]|uniref:DUF3397 family protein n=1 Tax=Clostridium bovifaecis TaxID=2184719 RepID=A0A6I6FCQ0_9CLOT|nr:hypothetical protein GOM49_11400 [Clostridium bovifaecis]
MNGNKKTNSSIIYLVTLLIFICYKYVPTKIQVTLPLILGMYHIGHIIYLIYKKSFWENVLRSLVLSIVMIVIFLAYYKSAFRLDESFIKIVFLVAGWSFPLIAFSGMASWKRNGNTSMYKKNFILFVYCLILAIFCTIIATIW